MSDLLCLIPARGGSKTVRRKNLRTIDGVTLVELAVRACRPFGRTVVSTDDQDIAAVARMCGAEVWDRPAELATDDASIDDLVRWVRQSYEGRLLVYQPTVPAAQPYLAAFIQWARGQEHGSAMSTLYPHIMWREGHLQTYRGQRQDLNWAMWQEVGVRYYPEGGWFLNHVWPCPGPLVDIDTPADLHLARQQPKRILFRIICNRVVGSGHVRRCVQLADELQHHDISFAPHPDTDLAMLADLAGGYPLVTDGYPRDLCVNDCLDTSEEQMFELRVNSPVVALEDVGPGAQHASLVVNELYPAHAKHELSGPDWAVLRPVFTAAPWPHRFDHTGNPRLLVSFGGCDPSGFSSRLDRIGGGGWDMVLVPPPSASSTPVDLASLLVWADLLVCSGGRTVWEAMACGTPALVLCQNARELTHSHLSPRYGVINLGLGHLVDDGTIRQHVERLLGDPALLADLSDKMTSIVDGKGALRIAHRIEGLLGGL